ncbi:MAG: YfiR family protein [Rhodobacteraceae bacterium]|nr:YfiR family protein [Paracoccaceae bacterium]
MARHRVHQCHRSRRHRRARRRGRRVHAGNDAARSDRGCPARAVHALPDSCGDQPLPRAVSGRGRAGRARETLAALKGRPILTVGDFHPFAARGGMIGLVQRDSRLAFEVNVDAAKDAGLTLSSRLLQLATLVPTTPPKPAP